MFPKSIVGSFISLWFYLIFRKFNYLLILKISNRPDGKLGYRSGIFYLSVILKEHWYHSLAFREFYYLSMLKMYIHAIQRENSTNSLGCFIFFWFVRKFYILLSFLFVGFWIDNIMYLLMYLHTVNILIHICGL